MAIHPAAIVEDGAKLGDGVEIGPFCTVGSSVVLGEGVRLISHVVISGNTRIGARTVIYPQSVLGGEAQIRKGDAPQARLEIGEDNVIREAVSINAGSAIGRGVTKIGDRNYFMAYSHMGHDCQIGNDVTLANGVQLGGHMEIGDGVIMGGLAAGQQYGRVGRYAFVSGLSGISTDIIPYGIAIGLHARLGGLNLIGLRRRRVPRPNIHALRAAYREIFVDGKGSIQENAKAMMVRGSDVPEVQEMLAFILADAKRPICPARKRGDDADEGE